MQQVVCWRMLTKEEEKKLVTLSNHKNGGQEISSGNTGIFLWIS
jgi:hypothetical protein